MQIESTAEQAATVARQTATNRENMRMNTKTREVEATNPHWIGDFPAWNVTLLNGDVDKSVSMKEIGRVHQKLAKNGEIHEYRQYITVVTNWNIANYAMWRETSQRLDEFRVAQ